MNLFYTYFSIFIISSIQALIQFIFVIMQRTRSNQYNNAMTGCSDCEIYALRQILNDVSRTQECMLITQYLEKDCSLPPTEHHLGLLLSPVHQKCRNHYGVYIPNILKHKSFIFPQGIRQQKKTHSKKYIAKNNINFLQQRIKFKEQMILENELSLPIIPYFLMIKSYLIIAKKQEIPIKLIIRIFKGNNLKNLSFSEISLNYKVKSGKYCYCQQNQMQKKKLIYECVSYKGQIQPSKAVDKICNVTEDQEEIECHKQNNINKQSIKHEFTQQINKAGGLQKLLLSDAAAHKQFAGLKNVKTDDDNFQYALSLVNQINDPHCTSKEMEQYRSLADQIGCSKKHPHCLFIIHVLAAEQA